MDEIIVAGFGGQGILVLGQLIAYAGMIENKAVSWFPSYGPEQRGGTCNCSVVVSDTDIGSPIVSEPTIAIIMNRPSLDRFEPMIKPGGLLLYNTTLIHETPKRSDIHIIGVPANEIGEELGNTRVSNMVLLGALVEATQIVSIARIEASLANVLSQRHHHLIRLNMQALARARVSQ